MTIKWYYVEKNDKAGPVDEIKIGSMVSRGELDENSYVWRKGFDNWKQIIDVPELHKYMTAPDEMNDEDEEDFEITPHQPVAKNAVALDSDFDEDYDLEESSDEDEESEVGEITQPINVRNLIRENSESRRTFDWKNIDWDALIFNIKIGLDRGTVPVEYGPYSLNMLKKLFHENRVNGKTYLFAPGMEDWIFLADVPNFQDIFSVLPPVIDESERRLDHRRPFVAKMFFHNNTSLYEGVCRDISVGGLQVLVSNPPVKVGETISMNVHPHNSEYSFVASGSVVRLLTGGQGFSLRFSKLNDEALNAINSYLERT